MCCLVYPLESWSHDEANISTFQIYRLKPHMCMHMYTRYIMCNLINVQLQPFKSTLSMAHVEMPRCVTNTCDDLPPDVLLQLSLVCVVVV